MSIENIDVVDFVSIDLDGYAVLTIADHLEWDEKNEHLLLLQNKINAYLSFIESGEIYKQYPRAKDRRIAIGIVAKYLPNADGELFLERVRETLSDAGYRFSFRVPNEGNVT